MPEGRDIVRKHGPVVWKTVYRLIGGPGREADVSDCFQDVFVAALEVGRREEVRNWEALLRRVATVKGLDMLRARMRGRERMAAVRWEELPERVGELPEAAMQLAEAAGELREALARLEASEAELFCLRHLEGMSYESIGEQMEMTAGAVGVALHRIKERLRGMLSMETKLRKGMVRDE